MPELEPFQVPAPTPAKKAKRKIRWRLIIAIFAVPLLLLALGTFLFRVAYTLRENQGRQEMSEKLADLQSRGIAVDSDSISQQYIDRTSDEKAFEWAELINAVESLEFRERTKGIPTFDPTVEVDEYEEPFDTPENWKFADAIDNLTTEFNHLIELSRDLACAPHPTCFPIFFQASETHLSEVQSVRTVARLLQADCQLAMYQHDAARAANDIVAISELSKHVDAVPSIVSRLVGIALRRMSLEALQLAIAVDLLTDDQLLEIDEILMRYCDIEDRWKQTILDEMSLNLPVFVIPHLFMDSDVVMAPRGHDAVYFIDTMVNAAETPTDDWEQFLRFTYSSMSKFDKDMETTLSMVDHILSGLLMPEFNALATAMINDAQLHRQARLAIALRVYQHRHDQFPRHLDELPKSTRQLVPFGNDPFGYRKDAETVTLWGFHLSDNVKQTPTLPPATDKTIPDAVMNRKIVWEMK